MYNFLNTLLSDKTGSEIFTLFGAWHFFYIALTVFVIALVLLLLKSKSNDLREKTTRTFIYIAFGLYILDFFLMPLAYGEIDIEKLPFHACTAMCVLCFLSYHNRFLEKYRLSFVLLGLISNLVYLIYPAGVMWHAVHPISYRVIQTLIFHSIMTIYGSLILIYEHDQFDLKKWYRDLSVIVFMTAWALVGNYAYNGTSDGYSHFFNWFFVIQDPFAKIPVNVGIFVMPFVMFFTIFLANILIYSGYFGIKGLAKIGRKSRS